MKTAKVVKADRGKRQQPTKPSQSGDDKARGQLVKLWNAFQLSYYLPHDRAEALEVLDLAREIVAGFGTGRSSAARFDKCLAIADPWKDAK
jgi:hypothetical protein